MKHKYIISVCLLLLVSIPIIAPLCFYIHQKHIRHEMEERLEKEQLVTITLKKLIWYKPDKELLIEGKMFDVHSVKQLNKESFIVTGIYDDQEKALFQTLNLLMKKKGNLSKQITQSISIFSYFSPLMINTSQLTPKKLNNHFFALNQKILSQFALSVITPPPNLAF